MKKTVKIYGREIDLTMAIPVVVIVYFGLLIGVLSVSLPELLPASARNAAVWFSVGILVFRYFGEEEDPFWFLKWHSPKIVCGRGVYSWSGESREVTFGTEKYTIFFEGINAGGVVEKGKSVFICPTRLVSSCGKNRLLKAKMKVTKTLDPDFDGLSDYKFVLLGMSEDAAFGSVSLENQKYKDVIDLLEARNAQLERANEDYVRRLSERGMVNSLNNPDFVDMIDRRLKGGGN